MSTDIGLAPRDESDTAFLIAAAGDNYYVNIAGDSDLSDNQYTTAAGDDALSGKSPDRPMASLAALLDAYDLGPGDVVHIDTGVYQTPRNIVITANDAASRFKVRRTVRPATFDRGNISNGSYVPELNDADGVTISHLSITGAQLESFRRRGDQRSSHDRQQHRLRQQQWRHRHGSGWRSRSRRRPHH
ncbi:MAG: hypothetical protein R3C99_00775 [Pirellulaceae bacterium]